MPRPRAETPPAKRRPNSEHQSVVGLRSVGALEAEYSSKRPLSPLLRRSRFSSVPLVEIRHVESEGPRFPASVELPRRHVAFYADSDSESSHSGGGLCSMSDVLEGSSKDGGGSPSAQPSVRIKHVTRSSEGSSRFPKLDECAHFHYDNVELGAITVSLVEERPAEQPSRAPPAVDAPQQNSSSPPELWWCARVSSNGRSWEVKRSLDNFLMLDRQLHCCVYERKFSGLTDLTATTKDGPPLDEGVIRGMLAEYLERFSQLAGSLINCGPVLNWLELDNRGYRLIVTDEAAINTPAVAAAYVTKRYAAQANDEIHLEVGDIISVIDMPPPEESSWWRGKKGFQVGFFPCECVEIIGDRVPQTIKVPKVAAKPVLRKHGKLIAFFRQFLLSRPSRRKLKQSGILKERVFGCDLGEHLMNSGRDIPLVLKCCAEFIEEHGIVDGIYRLSGVTSNIQKLRLAFDEDRVPNLMDEAILQDIHCVASLLKMYFRELPNPLLTFHLYDKFVNAVQADEEIRLLKLRDVVQQLPPPHYRSLEYLMRHLSKVAAHGSQTGMTPKNVAIVWAPNLLREIENGGVGALHVVGVQAVLTECLIRYTDIIFSEKMPVFPSPISGDETPKKIRPKSLAISTPTKLLSLGEARSRALASNFPMVQPKFIEVGGGVESLPPKYHTVIDVPGRRSGGKGKKSPLGWRSFFSRGWHTTSGRSKGRRTTRSFGSGQRPKISSPMFVHHSPLSSQEKAVTEAEVRHLNPKKLRTVKSAESLLLFASMSSRPSNMTESTSPPDEPAAFVHSPAVQEKPRTPPPSSKHLRSTSHDSYFDHLIDFPTCRGSDEELKPKDDSDDVSIRPREDSDVADSTTRSLPKQKLVSFETGGSSPKVQKLNLKRLYHTLSSPPMVRKKDTGDGSLDGDVKYRRTKSRRTHFGGQHSRKGVPEIERPMTVVLPSADYLQSENFVEVLDDGDKDKHTLDQDDESNDADSLSTQAHDAFTNASIEATLSETIGTSQLVSFEVKDGTVFSPANHDQDTCNALSAMPLDNSDTQDSLTTDNISDMPSSAGSEFSCSPGEVEKFENQLVASCSTDRSLHNGLQHPVESATKDGGVRAPAISAPGVSFDEDLAKQTSALQINNAGLRVANPSPELLVLVSPCVDDNLILSPPENFVDNKLQPDSGDGVEQQKTELQEASPKLGDGGKGVNDFASIFQDLHNASWSNKRRNHEKISPVSPVEESRRRFESEIGRLIVRDRQMRLEMEQMKAERQRCNFAKLDVCKKSYTDPCSRNEKKFSCILDTKKSPLRKRLPDSSDPFSPPKDNQELKRTPDWTSTSLYPQYMRMDKKPSVKELLSKFEVQQSNETVDLPPKSKENVFSNIQVIHHDFSKEISCDFSDRSRSDGSQTTQNRDHIFQTECVVRFPHPKASLTSTGVSPQHVTNESSPFLSSYLRSKSDASAVREKLYTPVKTLPEYSLNSSAKTYDGFDKAKPFPSLTVDNNAVPAPGEPWSGTPTPFCQNSSSTTTTGDDSKPSVKLKKQFLADFAQFPEDNPRTSARRSRPSPSKQRPRSVPPPLCRFSVTSGVRPPSMRVTVPVSYLDEVPKSSTLDQEAGSSQSGKQPLCIRERAAIFERSLSFSGYGDRKAFVAVQKYKDSSNFNRQ